MKARVFSVDVLTYNKSLGMKNKRPSMDGFVPRRASAELGSHHQEQTQKTLSARRKQLHAGKSDAEDIAKRAKRTTVGSESIRHSLEAIDQDVIAEKPRSRRADRRAKKGRRQLTKKQRIIKRIIIFIVAAVVAVLLFLGIKAFINLNNVFDGSFFGLLQKQRLKEDENGRSNFLIFGTEAEGHPGANLTDSIMVLSVNQTNKDAYMVSIPRDLWVDYGKACLSGYQGKINEVYMCGSDDGKDERQGAAALRKKVGEVLGLDIQYHIHLNFAAVEEIVDAVGGVTVTIESNPKGMGILDRNFDWVCNYQCHFVKYDDGQTVHLDGQHALALARARNAQGGYGLAGGNFDREKNQQKIIKALREKALSVGTLTNLGKVTSLMDALGSNLKTSIDKKEIQTLMALASGMDDSAIKSLILNDEKAPLVTTGQVGTASVVQPVAGLYDYSAIRAAVAKMSTNNPIVKESANIVVLNGTGVDGAASKEADVLKGKGFTVSRTDNAPQGDYGAVAIYKIGTGYDATGKALEEHYSVTVKTATPPISVDSSVSFVVVVGKVRQ